jgi:hypothetical protein
VTPGDPIVPSGTAETGLTNDVYRVRRLTPSNTNQKVVWFDITIYQRLFVNRLHTGYLQTEAQVNKFKPRWQAGVSHHLLSSHTNSLDCKLSPAHIKQILQIQAQKINNKNVVQTLLSKVMNLWNTSYPASQKSLASAKPTKHTRSIQRPIRPKLVP